MYGNRLGDIQRKDAGIGRIARGARRSKTLEVLDLGGNEVGPAGAAHIAGWFDYFVDQVRWSEEAERRLARAIKRRDPALKIRSRNLLRN